VFGQHAQVVAIKSDVEDANLRRYAFNGADFRSDAFCQRYAASLYADQV
jgi:hypothetical protein